MRSPIAVFAISLLLVACGPTGQSPNASGDKLYEAVGQSILVVDSKNHAVERRLPLGAPSPDWKHLYSMVGDSLVDTNPLTGTTQNTVLVGAQYQLPLATHEGLPGGLSPAGKWLVLQVSNASGTNMVVIDTTTFKVVDAFNLPGRFIFDAISDDGQRLYLIQYLDGQQYYVRLYDVNINLLDPNAVVDKTDGNRAMAGLRLSGVAARDGSSLFSMYVREHESPFIHALSLQGPFAFCLDLPGRGYSQWALAMNRDGTRLFAVGATGTVAEIEAAGESSPQVLRTAQIPAGSDAALLSLDGTTLVAAGSAGVRWIETSDLRVRMQSLSEQHVSGLALSPDGRTLFAVNDSGQVAEVSMASGAVVARFDPGAGRPIAVMRVASS